MRGSSVAFMISFIAWLQGTVSPHDQTTVNYITINTLTLTPTVASPISFEYGVSNLVTFKYAFVAKNITVYPRKGWILGVSVDNENVASLKGQNIFYINSSEPTGNLTILVQGDNAGRTQLRFRIQDWVGYPAAASGLEAFDHSLGEQKYQDTVFHMYVLMKTRPVDTIFNIVLFILVITANVGMGTQVDLEIVKNVLRRPTAPLIGLFSQFVFMPLTSYAVAVFLKMEPGVALGLFASGCAPGGMASNIFTYLLNGNVSLSITMTLISTLASLGMLPLWLFTLGTYLYSRSHIKIPFINIVVSLFIIVIPTVIGLLMKAKTPRAATLLIKSTKLIMACIMVFMFTVGVYANWWILDQVTVKVLIASAALPYLGFIFGGFAAFVGRQSIEDIVTIAVETGIQNTAVPIVLLRMSLSGPEQSTSIVVPLISSTLTPVPLIIAVIYLEVESYLKRKRQRETETEETMRENDASLGEKSEQQSQVTPIDPMAHKSRDSGPKQSNKRGVTPYSLGGHTKKDSISSVKAFDVDVLVEKLSAWVNSTQKDELMVDRMSTEIF